MDTDLCRRLGFPYTGGVRDTTCLEKMRLRQTSRHPFSSVALPDLTPRSRGCLLCILAEHSPYLGVLAHAVGVAADVDDMAVMQDAIDESGSHHLVAERSRVRGSTLLDAPSCSRGQSASGNVVWRSEGDTVRAALWEHGCRIGAAAQITSIEDALEVIEEGASAIGENTAVRFQAEWDRRLWHDR